MKEINNLVCSGGGVKGIAYIGVMKAIEEYSKLSECSERKDNERSEHSDEDQQKECASISDLDIIELETKVKINIKKICSISVGCFFGLLYAIGYRSDEILEEMMKKDFSEFINFRLSNMLNKYGMDSGKRIIKFLEDMLKKKSINKHITFKKLYDLTKIDFQVMTTNLNTYQLTTFDYINTPKTKVLKAIRMAISLPFIFTAEKNENDIHVDAALVDNFPIYLFDNELDNTIGVYLYSSIEEKDESSGFYNKIENIDDYISNVLTCFMLQKHRLNILKKKYNSNVIFVNSDGVNQSLNFNIENSNKQQLMESGYISTKGFLEKINKELLLKT